MSLLKIDFDYLWLMQKQCELLDLSLSQMLDYKSSTVQLVLVTQMHMNEVNWHLKSNNDLPVFKLHFQLCINEIAWKTPLKHLNVT